jgi:hypothetical protein
MGEACDDAFWRTTFMEAGIGKFHRGFRYENWTLFHKVRNREKSCNISGLHPMAAIEAVQTFMRNTAGIMSSTDIALRNSELKQLISDSDTTTTPTWGKIRSSQHRDILIANYVATIAERQGLSESEEEQLDTTIRIGILTKYFNSSTITISDSAIVNIQGLCRKPNGEFAIDYTAIPERTKGTRKYEESTSVTQSGELDDDVEVNFDPKININLKKKWNKFLELMFKRYEPVILMDPAPMPILMPDD